MDALIKEAYAYFTALQTRIVAGLEALDGSVFQTDVWTREQGGGGISRYQENGEAHDAGDGKHGSDQPRVSNGQGDRIFERAGVLFSHVKGAALPTAASAQRKELAGRPWEAMGVSMVLHPRNPYVPITHMNVRLFVAHPARDEAVVFWFGGGLDLTPCYPFLEDVQHFHRVCRDAVSPFGADKYPEYKAWCDRYFFLKHRQETRGVGGLFFDDLHAPDFDTAFALTRAVGDCFLHAYLPIVEKRRNTPYGQTQRAFQAYRRGRYVEFNLIFDRGTQFGLQSGGRTESILLSMPPQATWRYCWEPQAGSPEAQLASYLQPRDWL